MSPPFARRLGYLLVTIGLAIFAGITVKWLDYASPISLMAGYFLSMLVALSGVYLLEIKARP